MSGCEYVPIIDQRSSAEVSARVEERGNPGPLADLRVRPSHDFEVVLLVDVLRAIFGPTAGRYDDRMWRAWGCRDLLMRTFLMGRRGLRSLGRFGDNWSWSGCGGSGGGRGYNYCWL